MILHGDALEMLETLPNESAQCCVTSPPYWGLRDYGVPGQIGLEKTPQEYVEKIVDVFREVRRVLKPDGTLWLNLGDSYVGSWGAMSHDLNGKAKSTGSNGRPVTTNAPGLKSKDLAGIPWRVAFALQADGWWLRQDIIWSKPNPMPESVTDRCTKAHEYIFLLTKSARYYYDAAAIAEPLSWTSVSRLSQPGIVDQAGSDRVPGKTNGAMKAVARKSGNKARRSATERGCPKDGVSGNVPWEGVDRNARSVWTITTKPNKSAHFATFPPEIPEKCIRAGSRTGDTVLDPFAGSGTTLEIAARLDRECIGIELSEKYIQDLILPRMAKIAPLFPTPY
jgi:DNA modification methylase